MADAAQADPVVFEAVLTPHRSLSRRGVQLVIAFTCTISFGVTLLFWTLGAWPIAGFNGAEVLLAVFLLRAHVASRKQQEQLLLSAEAVRVVHTDHRGRRAERRLPTGWLNVLWEERPGRVPALLLTHRGQHIEVARALGEPEKRDLFEALSAAVYRLKNPVFDNPQLREC